MHSPLPSLVSGGYVLAAAAQTPVGSSMRPEDRSEQFVAVKGGQETSSAQSLLVAAYLVMWALLLGFVFMGWRRSLRIEGRLSSLEQALRRHETDTNES